MPENNEETTDALPRHIRRTLLTRLDGYLLPLFTEMDILCSLVKDPTDQEQRAWHQSRVSATALILRKFCEKMSPEFGSKTMAIFAGRFLDGWEDVRTEWDKLGDEWKEKVSTEKEAENEVDD